MENNIFRKKSLDSISSPDQIYSYMKVADTPAWIILIALALVLFGAIAWGIFGLIDSTVPSVAVVQNGKVFCYVSEQFYKTVDIGEEIKIGEKSCSVNSISKHPTLATETLSSYAVKMGNFQSGELVYSIESSLNIPDGTYLAEIVSEKVRVWSFLWN